MWGGAGGGSAARAVGVRVAENEAIGHTTVTRLIPAAPRAVYDALLDPAAVARWKVPDGMRSEVHESDARVGGR